MENVEIPRCLVPRSDSPVSTEFHAFCDASEESFATAIYVQNYDDNGFISFNLVTAKTRVAPKKTISVAKMELQAALLGTRVLATVQKDLSIEIKRRIYWTDSGCVRN